MSWIYKCPEPPLDPPEPIPAVPPRDEEEIFEERRDRKLWEESQRSRRPA